MTIVQERKIGNYRLVEKDITRNGEYEDTICEVFFKNKKFSVYCSITDALHHKCEWMEVKIEEKRGRGVIGSRTGFRFQRVKSCEFESHRPHQHCLA